MRLSTALLISSTLLVMGLSGCIDPSDLEAHAKDWKDESHSKSWEDAECEDDVASDSSGSSTHQHDEDEVGPEEAFEDAAPRYSNVVDGEEDSRRTISVPFAADSLRVALVHDSDAEVSFVLRDPLHRTWAKEEADGEKYLYEDKWADLEDPLPGEWTLDIEIDGDSSYTIGFYIDD